MVSSYMLKNDTVPAVFKLISKIKLVEFSNNPNINNNRLLKNPNLSVRNHDIRGNVAITSLAIHRAANHLIRSFL